MRLYEGKAKIVYGTENPDEVIVAYKDDATANNGEKRGQIAGKGALNTAISAIIFQVLEGAGVKTHFLEVLGETQMKVRRLQIIPVEVVIRNLVAGNLSKRLGIAEGHVLSTPVVEFYYKDDKLGDPMVNETHIQALGWANEEEIGKMTQVALEVNRVLGEFLRPVDLVLVDFKLEFGRYKGEILLGDEVSPDTCRFWDGLTGDRLDKDRFRRDLGGVQEAYTEVLQRVERAKGGVFHV